MIEQAECLSDGCLKVKRAVGEPLPFLILATAFKTTEKRECIASQIAADHAPKNPTIPARVPAGSLHVRVSKFRVVFPIADKSEIFI